MKTSTSRLYNVQALRAIAALMVLVAHMGSIEQKYGHIASAYLARFSNFVTGVDLFFCD